VKQGDKLVCYMTKLSRWFGILEKGPLSESCTYLSYGSVKELSQAKHLEHLSDSVIDEYAEEAD